MLTTCDRKQANKILVKLQNELGEIVLLKSRYSEPKAKGKVLKFVILLTMTEVCHIVAKTSKSYV